MDNDGLLARFEVEHLDRHSISTQRREVTLVILRRIAARLEGRTLIELTPSDVMAWQGSELGRGMSPNTVRNWDSMLRGFITWATAAGLISFERMTQLKSVSQVRGAGRHLQPRPYKRAEIALFRQELAAKYPLAPTRGPGSKTVKLYLRGQSPFKTYVRYHARRLQIEAQVSLALEEGLRCEELWKLTLPQMHYDNAAVVVISAKSEPGHVREREVPYTPHSRMCVREWLDFRSLMGPPPERGPWLSLSYADPTGPLPFRRFAEKTLDPIVSGFTWHRFRHTFATERLRAGLPLEQLQRMLGHATLTQTLAYAEIVNADLITEAERTDEQFARNLGLVA